MSHKAALLIGVSYLGTANQLKSSINAVEKMKNMLIFGFGIPLGNIKILTEKSSLASRKPTRANIIKEIKKLTRKTKRTTNKVTEVWLYYTGHSNITLGTYEIRNRDRTKDPRKENNDRFSSAIAPMDYKRNGFITDFILRKIFVEKLNVNSRCFAFFDSVHYNSPLDLEKRIDTNRRLQSVDFGNPEFRVMRIEETNFKQATVPSVAQIICINNKTCKVEKYPTGTSRTLLINDEINKIRKTGDSVSLKQLQEGLQTINTEALIIILRNGSNIRETVIRGTNSRADVPESILALPDMTIPFNISTIDLATGINLELKRNRITENIILTATDTAITNSISYLTLSPGLKRTVGQVLSPLLTTKRNIQEPL